MLALVIIQLVLLVLCYWIGALCVTFLKADQGWQEEDRFLLNLWVGLVVLGLLLLISAFFRFLSPYQLVFLVTVCVILQICLPMTRKPSARSGHFFPALFVPFLSVLTAFIGVQTVSSRDSISYHYDIIQWLSKIGFVPGLALIHDRFGFISSWFALPAVFNHGPLEARVATVAGSFVLLLAGMHVGTALFRILSGKSRMPDLFLALCLPMSLVIPVFLNHPVSPTPDVGVVVLTVIVAWTILELEYGRYDKGDERAVKIVDSCILPVVLASCALAIKLNAGPLLLVTAVYYLHRKRYALKAQLACGAVCASVLLPLALAGVIVSGCAFFPFPMCLDVPWSVGEETARKASDAIYNYARWGRGETPPRVWILHWLEFNKANLVAALYLALSAVSLRFLAGKKRHEIPGSGWIILLGLAGMLFWGVLAPDPRFAWGYLSVLPALLWSAFLVQRPSTLSFARFFFGKRATAFLLSLFLLTVLFVPLSMLGKTRSEKLIDKALNEGTLEKDAAPLWLVPPMLFFLHYDDENDRALPKQPDYDPEELLIETVRPMSFPVILRDDLDFRDPSKGLNSGFVRKSVGDAQ